MIDQIVEELSEEFLRRVQAVSSPSLAYQYNYTIFSLSVLDLYFQPSLYKGTKQQLSEDIVLAAAYVGCISYRLLNSQSAKVNLTYIASDPEKAVPEIRLKITSHPNIENWHATINLTDVLVDCFSSSISPKPYAIDEIIPFGLKTRPCFYHAFGIISGLHPLFKHKKAPLDELALAPHLQFICDTGANDTAQLFSLHAPGKEKLMSPAIFKQALVFPPPGFKESNFGERFVATFSQALKENNFQDTEIPNLIYILLESPYILHYLTGAVYAATYGISSERALLNELNEEFPLLAPSLIKNIFALMKITGKNKAYSFPEVLDPPDENTATDILMSLQQMGFFPLLYCTSRSIMSAPDFRMYFELICNGLLKEAILLGGSYLRRGPNLPLEIALQHAFILFEIGEKEAGFHIINTIKTANSDNRALTWATDALMIYYSNSGNQPSTETNRVPKPLLSVFRILQEYNSIEDFAGKIYIARKLCMLSCIFKIDESEFLEFSKIINTNPGLLSCKAVYLLQSQNTAQATELKVPGLRRAHWSPFRFHQAPPNNGGTLD